MSAGDVPDGTALQLCAGVEFEWCVASGVPSRLTAARAGWAGMRIRAQTRRTGGTVQPGRRRRRHLLAGFPGSDWVANTRAAQVGTMTVGRRVEQVRLIELTPEESVPVLWAWPVRIRQGARIMRDAGAVADLEPDSLAALVGRCAAIRIDPM